MLELTKQLKTWVKRKEKGLEAPQVFAHILAKERPATSPTFQNLLPAYKAKVNFLLGVAEELGLAMAIGQLNIQVKGSAVENDFEDDYMCGRFHCDGCEECDEREAEREYEMDEDGDRETTYKLDLMTRPDERGIIDLGRMRLSSTDIMPEFNPVYVSYDDIESNSEEVTHLYWRPVLVVWPQSEEASIVLHSCSDQAINKLFQDETTRLQSLTDAPTTGVLVSPLLSRIRQADHIMKRPACKAAILQQL